jgi:hypothetical protein
MSAKQKRRELYLKRYRNTCRHFNGIQHGVCEAGLPYKNGSIVGRTDRRIPCLVKSGDNECDGYQHFSEQEIEAMIEANDRSQCCNVPLDKNQVIGSGANKGHGPGYCSDCGNLCFMV